MKHRRGIDLLGRSGDGGYTVGDGSRRDAAYETYRTIAELPRGYILVGFCPRCRRYGQIERSDVRRVLGADAHLSSIPARLSCSLCHSRTGNKASIRKLPR